jgi:hypothetical protein
MATGDIPQVICLKYVTAATEPTADWLWHGFVARGRVTLPPPATPAYNKQLLGRPPRSGGEGLLYHALNRGKNWPAVFHEPADYRTSLDSLAQTSQRYPFRLFGSCLLTNHSHRLLQPVPGQNIGRILQSLTMAHTGHYHQAHASVGHV